MSINKVFVSGNLTRDAELRNTASGLPVLGFGMAVNDRRKNTQTGAWEDFPNYVDLTIFGTRAESLAPSLRKGARVAVEGKLRYSQWESKDGQKRSKLEVVVDEIVLMQRDSEHKSEPKSNQNRTENASGSETVYDDDIPF